MDFSRALVLLKDDCWMRRRAWLRYKCVGICHPEDQESYIVVKVPFDGQPNTLKTLPWIAEVTSSDLLAEDWEEVPM